MQLPLFPRDSSWAPPTTFPDWSRCPRIGLDTETYDPNLKKTGPSVRTGGHLVGVSISLEDGPTLYLPFRHSEDNLDEGHVLAYLRAMASEYTGVICGTNLNYDLDYLAQRGITFPKIAWQRDIQIADALLNELHDKYSLDAIAKRWGFAGKDETLLRQAASDYRVEAKGGLHQLPARYVAEYAEEDARLPLQILRLQEAEIQRENLQAVYDLESRLQPVLLKMRRQGVRIDLDKLQHVEEWSAQQEGECLDSIHSQTGIRVKLGEVMKKGPLVRLLEHIGVEYSRTPTGQPCIDQDLLDSIEHPVGQLLLRARKVNKLRTTFVASIREHMVGDRIHCTFNQLRHGRETGDTVGARYGRLSSEHPNLQQQPARDDFAALWRSIYVPDTDGQLWFSADYSQQEPRLLTHFAEEMDLPGAQAAAERYRTDPDTDNHQMMADLCGIKRKAAKAIFLGLCYGMGGAKLADSLGLPTSTVTKRDGTQVRVAGPEADRLLTRFDNKVPFVRLLASRFEDLAREWGYITTISGRSCRFPQKSDGEYDWCYKAINRLIQGSAGDQTKMAMVAVDAAGLPLQLQVHDELCGSADSKEEARQVARVMEQCLPLRVPSRVDLALGASWGEAKE